MSDARRFARWLPVAVAISNLLGSPIAADEAIESLAVPHHVLGVLWIEQRYECRKNALNLEAVAPRVLCDAEIVDARVLMPTSDQRISLPVAIAVRTDPPKRWLWWWSERGFELTAYGAGWSDSFSVREGKLGELNGSAIEGAPRFVPHPHLTLESMPLANRKVSALGDVAGVSDNLLFSIPASRREGMRRFVDDLYYLLAERLTDRDISADNRRYLEIRRNALDSVVRAWGWLDANVATAADERALARSIVDPRPWIRWRAAVAVGGLGARGLDAALAGLAAPERESRLAGCLALRAIGGSGASARERLLALARDGDREVRCRAADALAAVDPKGSPAATSADCWAVQ